MRDRSRKTERSGRKTQRRSTENAKSTAGRNGGICFSSGRELASLIRSRTLSAREVMAAHLDRIHRLNPILNAIVAKLDDDECFRLADEADRTLARGDEVGALHGLPWAFKDLEDAVGLPSTSGSPIFKDRMPQADSPLVELLRHAGVIPIGDQRGAVQAPSTLEPHPRRDRVAGDARCAGER